MLSAKFHWDCYMLQMCCMGIALKRDQYDVAELCQQNANAALDSHFESLDLALDAIEWPHNG